MSDLGTEILKRYGATAVAFALVTGCAIWGLAHVVAAPDSEVSVLWGLVKYTKKTELTEATNLGSNLSSERQVASRVAEAPQSSKPTWPAIELFLRSDVRQATLEKTLTSIRSDKNLRQLTTAESGRHMREIPSGTYFYFFGGSLRTDPYTSILSLGDKIATQSVSRYRTTNSYVEIQYPRGEKQQLILFVDELTAQKVARLSGTESQEITAALSPWGNSSTLVSLPVDRVVRSRVREVEPQKTDMRLVIDILLQ
jgi:hypothetical protein